MPRTVNVIMDALSMAWMINLEYVEQKSSDLFVSEFADPTYTVKELKAKIAKIGLKLPAKGSGKDGRLVKKDYEKILKMYKNKAVLELIKESTTYTVKELKAKIAEMGFNKKDYILMLYITLALLKKKPRAQ